MLLVQGGSNRLHGGKKREKAAKRHQNGGQQQQGSSGPNGQKGTPLVESQRPWVPAEPELHCVKSPDVLLFGQVSKG